MLVAACPSFPGRRRPGKALLALLLALLAAPLLSAAPPEAHTVYIAGGLSDEQLLVLGSALASPNEPGLLLLDSDGTAPYLKAFLAAYKPTKVIPIGRFEQDAAGLERRWGLTPEPIGAWPEDASICPLWQTALADSTDLVLCPAEPRDQLLQAGCLAGLLRAPLVVVHGQPEDDALLRQVLSQRQVRHLYRIGSAPRPRLGKGVQVTHLDGASIIAASYRRTLTQQGGRIRTLVAANPADRADKTGSLSVLAPWLAVRKRAALLLTAADGKDVAEIVSQAVRHAELRRADALLLLADLKHIPVEERPNPIPGDKDKSIEMEPLTPSGSEPVSFATGRLFHEDRAVIPLVLARQCLLTAPSGPRRILVASNSGGGLQLLEAFSRTTVQELRNAGYQTTALFGKEVSAAQLRQQLPQHDIFLWEGHQSTLIREFRFHEWSEPLPPELIFLQSCLALEDYKVHPALARGAVGVIGTSTRTYSASGGACSLAFFDALLYEGQTVGGALRQAKNFLLAYALLKDKRLGSAARRKGANLRAAWAFTLWGDPTLQLPAPEGEHRQTPISHEVKGHTIRLLIPAQGQHEVHTPNYSAVLPPNGRLAGLVRKGADMAEPRALLPLLFAEVRLPHARPGYVPCLHSRLPSSRWVFCWDGRRRCGYLLALPRESDQEELRFRVEWKPVAEGSAAAGEIPTPASGGR